MSLDQQLELAKTEAEFHAQGVRQSILQRGRISKLLNAIGLLHGTNTHADMASILKQIDQSPTEIYQDIYCMLMNGGKRNGFFVEFGACDGLLLSNTVLLEKEFGWNGILCEAMPEWHAALASNRKCIIDHRCVWSESNQQIDFTIFENDAFNTQSSASIENAPAQKAVKEILTVQTVSLHDLLVQHSAPKTIDLLTVDVEGGEYEVFKNFPFDDYRFDFMCVERTAPNWKSVLDILCQNKYKQVFDDASEDDAFFIPRDHPRAEILR